jgi:hypothetical protein
MGKYKTFGSRFDRVHRNDLNANFADVEADINAQKNRVDNLIAGTPQPSEVVDSRGGFPVLRDRLDNLSTSLAQNTKQVEGWLNVKSYGATGNGETDDYQAIQNCINDAYTLGINKIFIPNGYYYVSQTLRTRNDASWDYVGIEILGAGLNTKLSRNKKSSPINGANLQANQDDTILANEPVFAIHSVKNILSNFTIINAKVGLYIGQDPRNTAVKSHCHYNRISNIYIQHVGSGICFRSGYGDYYNFFSKVQVASANIGIDVIRAFNSGTGVTNRNVFMSCEIDKARAGVILLNGDTNVFNAVHFEGIGASGYGVIPSVIPDGIETAIYVKSQLNSFEHCMCEANNRDVYDDAYGTNYINNYFNLYNGKFKRGSNSNLGTYIGSGVGGVADSFKNGGLLYQTLNNVTGKGALDDTQPAYATIAMGDLHDKGYPSKKQDLVLASDQIQSVTSDSVSRYKALGGVKDWWIHATVTPIPTLLNTDTIKIESPIPIHDELSVYAVRVPQRITIVVRSEIVIASFTKSNGKTFLSIPAPTSGWNMAGTTIDAQIRYY